MGQSGQESSQDNKPSSGRSSPFWPSVEDEVHARLQTVKHLVAEMERNKPALVPPAGDGAGPVKRFFKRVALQLMRPFARQQIDHNATMLMTVDLLRRYLLEVQWREVQKLRDENRQLLGYVKGLTSAMEAYMSARGRAPAGAAVAAASAAAAPSADAADAEMTEAVERGFMLRNVCPGATNVMDEADSWDVLMILDACRYDVFERVNSRQGGLAGTLSKRISVGSTTLEWLRKTFDGRAAECSRIVYVSGNPQVSLSNCQRWSIPLPFAHVEEAWREGWDRELETMPPDRLADAYLKVRDRFPGMKFILHFMQPHHPFIGKTRIRRPVDKPAEVPVDTRDAAGRTLWFVDVVRKGIATIEQLRAAYEANLPPALEAIAALLPKIDGKVAITADHGEMLGEYGQYDHAEGMYFPQLIEVPWFICGKGA
ncbi:MAG: hypothetical protein ACE15C_16680 [Phycisphaerae bacterium]